MNDFVYQSPTRFVFGRGFVDRIGSEMARLAYAKVLEGMGPTNASAEHIHNWY